MAQQETRSRENDLGLDATLRSVLLRHDLGRYLWRWYRSPIP